MSERFARVALASRSSRWRAPIVVSGAALHAALFTGMWISGLWKISLVEASGNEVTISMPLSPPPMDAAPKASPKPKAPQPKPAPKEAVQPQNKPPEKPPEPAAPDGPGDDGPDTGGGTGDGLPGGSSDGVPTTEPPPAPPPEPAPPPAPPPQPHRVGEKVLEQQRISGDKLIRPDDSTSQRMAREGVSEVRVTLKLCLDEQGRPSSTAVLRSSGYQSYDDKLEREMASWRYRPYTVDGIPSAVCTTVVFLYRQR